MKNSLFIVTVGLGAVLCFCETATMRLAGAESPVARQYAPSREIDLLHLALDVTPDFRQRTITAQATLRFKPIAMPLDELRLDAVDLEVTNLVATEKVLGWQIAGDKIVVNFDPPIPPGKEASVTISYRAQPVQGLFFRTREMGYPAEDEHLFTQGEAISARHWYPGFDSPNEKFTSEVTCRVPDGMVVLSNGRKISEEKAGGLVAVRWLQDKPHANYLVTLVAGYFKKIEARHKDVPLAFWTVPSASAQAAASFAGTDDMMAFFEQETGVPFPWARYDQVCVLDFVAGGMENTSLTVLNNETLFTPESENLRNSESLVAHELAHQWFGDLVTCKDWSHIWLNEGFATYYDDLYDERKNGRDHFLYRLWQGARTIVGQPNDTRPMVFRGYVNPNEMFDWRAYGKGAWVLHMLRSQLGPDLYRRCVKTYLERHQYGNVTTDNFSAVIEELSGRSYDQFFDQWLYHARTPELEADYAWDEHGKLARLTIRQTQPVSDSVLLFKFPLTVRFKSKAGTVDRQVIVKEKSEDFYFRLPQAPEMVRIDPELAVLAKINFRPPNPMLNAQLGDDSDVVGRLLAIEQFQSRQDHEAVAKLKELLNHDRFYGVRVEASAALRAIHTSEALEALLASTHQSDARVRRAVLADLGHFFSEAAFAEILRAVKEEKNPDIIAETLGALAACPKPEVRDILLTHLHSTSYKERLVGAAMRTMRARQDPANVGPLLETMQRREKKFPSPVLAIGLDALARLARWETNRDTIRDLITQHTTDLRRPVRLAALNALGTLEDPRALPVLDTFASAAKDSPERQAAERAIETIRAARKGPVELGDLRKEVLDLQKENRDLRRQFDTLQKKIEASSAPKTNPPARTSAKRNS